MKKFILFLLILGIGVVGASCMDRPTGAPKSAGAALQNTDMGFSLPLKAVSQIFNFSIPVLFPDIGNEPVEDEPSEQNCYSDDIPLTYEEQGWLQSACEEFGVPYALALGLIEKKPVSETLLVTTELRQAICRFRKDGIGIGWRVWK